MPLGGGKYDDLVEHVYAQTKAKAALVIIVGGDKGAGFSVKGDLQELLTLPHLLRIVADGIEQDQHALLAQWLRGSGARTCPRCGMTTHNSNDVEQEYCGACHDFT